MIWGPRSPNGNITEGFITEITRAARFPSAFPWARRPSRCRPTRCAAQSPEVVNVDCERRSQGGHREVTEIRIEFFWGTSCVFWGAPCHVFSLGGFIACTHGFCETFSTLFFLPCNTRWNRTKQALDSFGGV